MNTDGGVCSTQMSGLSTEDKQKIVDHHNLLRSEEGSSDMMALVNN